MSLHNTSGSCPDQICRKCQDKKNCPDQVCAKYEDLVPIRFCIKSKDLVLIKFIQRVGTSQLVLIRVLYYVLVSYPDCSTLYFSDNFNLGKKYFITNPIINPCKKMIVFQQSTDAILK